MPPYAVKENKNVFISQNIDSESSFTNFIDDTMAHLINNFSLSQQNTFIESIFERIKFNRLETITNERMILESYQTSLEQLGNVVKKIINN